MKTFKLLAFGVLLILAGTVQGQLSVNVHIGSPPAWGPAGYSDVHYYYLPDIECYYDIHSSAFIYYSGNRWIHSRSLPGRYRNYDLYGGYKVPMNGYRGNAPYTHFKEYRVKYAKGYRGKSQRNIGERHDNRDKGREANQRYRMDKHENNRNVQRNDNRGNQPMTHQNQMHGNDNGRSQGNNHNQKQGNDNGKNNVHDNGNKK